MEPKHQTHRKTKTERQAEARGRLIFGVIAAIVVVGLIALIVVIDRIGQSRMANVEIQTRDAAER